jgi:hypothetical protein
MEVEGREGFRLSFYALFEAVLPRVWEAQGEMLGIESVWVRVWRTRCLVILGEVARLECQGLPFQYLFPRCRR